MPLTTIRFRRGIEDASGTLKPVFLKGFDSKKHCLYSHQYFCLYSINTHILVVLVHHKCWPSTGHSNGLVPRCVILCPFKCSARVNDFPQPSSGHANRLSSSCFLWMKIKTKLITQQHAEQYVLYFEIKAFLPLLWENSRERGYSVNMWMHVWV